VFLKFLAKTRIWKNNNFKKHNSTYYVPVGYSILYEKMEKQQKIHHFTVAWESILPLAIFPILLPNNLELTLIFWGFVSLDLHNMPTTMKMQNICSCLTNKQKLSVHNDSPPPKNQYFVVPPFVAITAAHLLGYVSISLAHLATGIFAHSSKQNCSSSFKLDGFCWCTAVLKSYHRFSI
jgi:hypothetical protein